MSLVIRPNEGVGPINFGMSRDEVRHLFAEEPRIKASEGRVPSDYFSSIELLVHYADDQTVEAIEIGGGGDVEFLKAQLLKRPFQEVVSWMRTMDRRLQIDDTGFTSLRFGVGVYAPQAAKSLDAIVDGVIAFRPGYYD